MAMPMGAHILGMTAEDFALKGKEPPALSTLSSVKTSS